MAQKTLSYQYNEFMKWKEFNNTLPQSLVSYCVDKTSNTMADITEYSSSLENIITHIMDGKDPNIMVFKNNVKFYVNMIHNANYVEYLDKIRSLDYSTKENIDFLISELISCASRCDISVKGLVSGENNSFKTIPEICGDVCKNFYLDQTLSINFRSRLLNICNYDFIEFMDLTKALDENNVNTSDNYKGFMTFMGLLYCRDILNTQIILKCIESIKHSIFCFEQSKKLETHSCSRYSNDMHYKHDPVYKNICYYDCNKDVLTENVTYRTQTECSNLHKGYEFLINNVIESLNVKITELLSQYTYFKNNKEKLEIAQNTIDEISKNIDLIIKSHQELLNLCKYYKSMEKNQKVNVLKPNVIATHNTLGLNLNKLRLKLIKHTNVNMDEYVKL